jgi:hypothetical protein
MSRYARPKGSRLLRGLWKLSKFVFLLVAVAALGLYGYVRYDYSSAAGHLAGATAQAESLGLPLLPQDLQMDPPVTDAQNAAPLYRQIHARWESRSKELQSNATRVALQAVYDQDAADLSAARKTLDGVADELRLASQAAQLPGVDYKRKWADGPFVILPEFKTYKDIVKRLSERSLLNAREGKLREALEDLRTASMVARHASSEPVLIAGLVHIACESIALNAARRIATLRAEDAQALRDLRACIGEFPAKPGIEHYLKGEVFFGYWTSLHLYEFVRRSRAELDYDMFSEPVPMIALTPPLFERDLVQKAHAATVLRYWLEAFTVGRSVDWEPREVGKRLDVMARQCELSLRPRDQALKVLFPVFAGLGEALLKNDADRLTSMAMADVLLFRNRHGRLPKDLAEAGVSALDPFDGKPLKYRTTSTGFRIYSSGGNGKDDGGYFRWERKEHQDQDVAIAAYPAGEARPPKS